MLKVMTIVGTRPELIKMSRVIAEFDYAHPIFDGPAITAQQHLPAVQGENGIWLCGAWGGYGFHEDGLKSALRVVNGMGIRAPWQGESLPVASGLATV